MGRRNGQQLAGLDGEPCDALRDPGGLGVQTLHAAVLLVDGEHLRVRWRLQAIFPEHEAAWLERGGLVPHCGGRGVLLRQGSRHAGALHNSDRTTNTTHTTATGQLDEAVVSPAGAPAVLDKPVWLTTLSAIADN